MDERSSNDFIWSDVNDSHEQVQGKGSFLKNLGKYALFFVDEAIILLILVYFAYRFMG